MLASHNLAASQTRLAGLQAQDVYTDLNSLQHLKQMDGEKRERAMRELAGQFESMFLHMMMKSMRAANAVFEQDNPLNSSAVQLHRDMLDSQLALHIGKGSRLGLAESLYRQLLRTYGDDADTQVAGPLQQQLRPAPVLPASSSLPASPPPLSPVPSPPASSSLPASSQPSPKPVSTPSSPASPLLSPAVSSPPASTPPSSPAVAPVRRVSLGDKQSIAADRDGFVAQVYPHARRAAAKLGVDAGVLIAQAALETGWGRHVIHDGNGHSSHNLFNIKADTRWRGDAIRVPTLEYRQGVASRETAAFRQYGDIQDSFDDYVAFLSGNARYRQALSVTADADKFVRALQDAGYATDPAYADKVLRILHSGPLRGESLRGESLRGEPLRGESLRGESLRSEPLRREPLGRESQPREPDGGGDHGQ
ncbi:flagellar assembly peptidoglycan hydrolase FlgJ [Exilibacterium tricleocarpae]|uniref:Peptidoglycan hydrolase FlgJ n=1 Tax=Exilibacterium tricleocarpae TaxID=2591008 RepID=A0A545U3S5_9GAMM|nr:flagellar assembly peptidoglycan hydrolase FlgJ [Exilibacterium tricleocarpae]TQV84137.1 flagellar assembly peptidoglycan hydrolase FlgJ [Exilibacterium tricleocarpae]